MQTNIFWVMGVSGAGKTTLTTALAEHLQSEKIPYELIDGDFVREFFDADYGYSQEDRFAVTKRIAFAAYLLAKNGVTAIVANISPYHEVQEYLAQKLEPYYQLIYLKTSMDAVQSRDVKGLYKSYQDGNERNVIGLDEPFDEPKNPALTIETDKLSEAESVSKLIEFVKNVRSAG